MERLTIRNHLSSGYHANPSDDLPAENSWAYKDLIIDKCGKLEDLVEKILDHNDKNDMIMDVIDDMKELGLLPDKETK